MAGPCIFRLAFTYYRNGTKLGNSLRAKKLSHAHMVCFHEQIPERLGLWPFMLLRLFLSFFDGALKLLPHFVNENLQGIRNELPWIGSEQTNRRLAQFNWSWELDYTLLRNLAMIW